jgi:hypothetical protein
VTEPVPAHGCMIDGQPAMPILISEYNRLVGDLAALRADIAVDRDQQWPQRLAQAEATVARVHALADRWTKAGPPPLGTPIARWVDRRLVELNTALAEPKDAP